METQNNNIPYQPVSCDLIDILEEFELKQQKINLKIQDPNGQVAWIHGKVADIFTRDHAEFVKLEDGSEVRLDRIIEHHLYQ